MKRPQRDGVRKLLTEADMQELSAGSYIIIKGLQEGKEGVCEFHREELLIRRILKAHTKKR